MQQTCNIVPVHRRGHVDRRGVAGPGALRLLQRIGAAPADERKEIRSHLHLHSIRYDNQTLYGCSKTKGTHNLATKTSRYVMSPIDAFPSLIKEHFKQTTTILQLYHHNTPLPHDTPTQHAHATQAPQPLLTIRLE